MGDIPIVVDNGVLIQDLIGKINSSSSVSELLVKMMSQGYSYRITPMIMDGKLVSISLNTSSQKKVL